MPRDNRWLLNFRNNVTSQFGEDGILSEIFRVIGEGGRWCVELGALNGKHHSNTWDLINNRGWSAVLVEGDPTYFRRLAELYRNHPKTTLLNKFVNFEGPESLDEVLSGTRLPREFELFSLDIDGNDYHIWDSLKNYRPKVVVVEFNPSIPDEVEFIQTRDMSVQQGSSLSALVKLGKQKRYELVATTDLNALFVRGDLFPQFEIADNSPALLRLNHDYETRLFQLYDGTLVLSGCDRLLWHRKKIDLEALQVIPKRQRRYPAALHPNPAVRRLKDFVRNLPFYELIKKLRGVGKS